jgi:hypothetical protein
MDNEGLKNSVVRLISKNGELTEEVLSNLKDNSTTVKNLRQKIDNNLEQLKINIIKSSTHLLIDKIHRGDIESSIKILENTRDRSVFFDFITLFDELLVLHEQYYQKLDIECSDIKELKDNLGMNDHKLHKIISEMSLDN